MMNCTYRGVSRFKALPAVALLLLGTSGAFARATDSAGEIALSPMSGVTSGDSYQLAPNSMAAMVLAASGTRSDIRASGPGSAGVNAIAYGSLAKADLGIGASLNGAQPFPIDNPWNRSIADAPVDPNSDALIASIGLRTGLFADFGSGRYRGALIGIPYVVVGGKQKRVAIRYTMYDRESDPGPFPVPPGAPVEGTTESGAGEGDRHVLVIDRDNNRLYELYRAFQMPDGSWNADSGAVFHLDANNVRPTARAGWSSADAAGLPIFPGLVRYDEASTGVINHALRFTVKHSRRAYVPPATHWASRNTSPDLPPMGMRVRLKRSYIIPASFSKESRAILQALKDYGMFMADNGSNWFISGAPDPRWDNARLKSELGRVTGENFEVIRMDGIVLP